MLDREFERAIYKLKTRRQDKKELDKEIKDVEVIIKDEFESRGTDYVEYETIGARLNYSIVEKTSMDEDVLLSILNKLIDNGAQEVADCIEMKPVINEDKVQELIYKGIVAIEDIAPAVIDKSYKTLKFAKIKK